MNFKALLAGLINETKKEVGRMLTKDEETRIRTNMPTRGKWNTTRARTIMHFSKATWREMKTSSGGALVRMLGPLCEARKGKSHAQKKRETRELRRKYTKRQWQDLLAFTRRESFKEGRGIASDKVFA